MAASIFVEFFDVFILGTTTTALLFSTDETFRVHDAEFEDPNQQITGQRFTILVVSTR